MYRTLCDLDRRSPLAGCYGQLNSPPVHAIGGGVFGVFDVPAQAMDRCTRLCYCNHVCAVFLTAKRAYDLAVHRLWWVPNLR